MRSGEDLYYKHLPGMVHGYLLLAINMQYYNLLNRKVSIRMYHMNFNLTVMSKSDKSLNNTVARFCWILPKTHPP
eukprot:m.4378 g.4378  ORF g.4378 m.4378 type:complete len:75 (+) comp3299_c0_seq1:158-382(+)